MRRIIRIRLMVGLCLAALAGVGAAVPSGGLMESLKDLLPAVVESAGWRAQGAPQVFSGRELYGYMDGGADVVLEYGFSRVIVQDYKDAAARTITVEVFELDTPDDAYGLYTFKTGPEGEARPIGAESRLADYYLNVWKGRYVVTLTGLDESPEVRAGLEAIGRAVVSRITSSSAVPGIVSLLPPAGRLDGTVKYLRGRLGLFQSLPYFTSDVFAFAAGAKGDYAGSLTLILLEYPTAAAARERLEAVRPSFRENPKFSGTAESAGVFEALDTKGRAILLKASGRHLVIVLAPRRSAAAPELLARAEERLVREAEPSGR